MQGEHPETVDDVDSVSSGSMSPDLGDVWRQGCPESLEWEGDLELGSADEDAEGDNAGLADENEGEGLEDSLKQAIESPLWVLVRDFLSSADVLEIAHYRTQVECSKTIRSLCRIVILPHEKRRDKSEPLPEWPSLKFDSRPIYGFDLGILGPASSLTVGDANSGEWPRVRTVVSCGLPPKTKRTIKGTRLMSSYLCVATRERLIDVRMSEDTWTTVRS